MDLVKPFSVEYDSGPVALAHESFCIKPQNLGHLDTNIWVISPYKGQADAHSMALEVLLCDVVPCVKAPGYHCS